jgi:outer membrane protein TolC
MWIVRLALSRPYTFVVVSIMTFILGPLAILLTPVDIFPYINIPVGSVVFSYTGFVAAAERRIDAANAHIGVAQAAFYPTLTLGGAGDFESIDAGKWFQRPSALWGLGASAAETLFDAGRRRAVKRQAIAAYEQQAADHRQSVLQAFEEVENTLAASQVLALEAKQQGKAVADANRSLLLSTSLYKHGSGGYLQVITGQTTLLVNQRNAVDIAARQATNSLQLIKALGGGRSTAALAPRETAW